MDYSLLTKSENELLTRLCYLAKVDVDEAYELLSENDWDLKKAMTHHTSDKKSKHKEKKEFKKGDIIKCIDNEPHKLPKDCYEFLMTYKKFKVLDVNEKLNIDIGHRLDENGNPYYFSPNRFELLNGIAPKKTIDNRDETKQKNSKIIKNETPKKDWDDDFWD